MTDFKVSDLSAIGAVTATTLFYADDAATDTKATALQVRAYIAPQLALSFNARADSTTSLTAMPAADNYFPVNSKRAIRKIDLTNFLQCRMVVNVVAGATPSGKLVAKYKTTLTYASDAATAFSDIGTSEVSCLVATAGLIVTSWIDLAAGAKADVFVAIVQTAGDGTSTPGIGGVDLEFK